MKIYEILSSGGINLLEGFFLKNKPNPFIASRVKVRYSLDEATINTTVATIRAMFDGEDYKAIPAVSDDILETARAKQTKMVKGAMGNWAITLFVPSPKYSGKPFVQVVPPKESRDVRPTYYTAKEK